MNVAVQKFCAWAGVIYIVMFCVAMIPIAQMIPPPSPAASRDFIVQFYQSHTFRIRAAGALMVFCVPLGFCWSALVATWTARIEGPTFPVLSWSQLMCGVFSFGGAYLGAIDFVTAAFRPDRLGDVIYAFNDNGWFWMVMPGSCAVMQCVFIGIAILSDKRRDPLFPRWVGYFNIWVGLLQIPGDLICFFKDGPFAWNGLLAFWMALTVFSLWIYVDTWALLRAIKRERATTPAIAA